MLNLQTFSTHEKNILETSTAHKEGNWSQTTLPCYVHRAVATGLVGPILTRSLYGAPKYFFEAFTFSLFANVGQDEIISSFFLVIPQSLSFFMKLFAQNFPQNVGNSISEP